ncbi:glycosyltransferase family protein [Pedobacter sandarakinus]|uniref:glycosyltransferase family protein n=1 Tax=Pedobacter sandarakinus TaxID=353156 RepID=UPI00224534E1|nr:glycosyltransferase family protein [Pedobacter sandarakinus]MCX2573985.1 glycosyl transferase [Pedobacter sandarakinus]
MKILYAIQGTGNGHISRAREIIPLLEKYGELDILVSGTQADVKLSQPIKYQLHGFSFIFGKKGGVDHFKTWLSMNLFRFRKDMKQLQLKDYNLIVNDFEPVSAWACKLQGIECVSLSHQAAFKSKKVPRPKTLDWGKLILSRYAPTNHHIGFHFDRYDSFIHTPVIRSEIRQMKPENLGHYTVYLPAVDDKRLLKLFMQIPDVQWQVFSKHSNSAYREANVSVEPVNNERFNKSLATCTGLFTGGGFEGPAEALFLKKKLLVAPMRFQFEQQCNAYALKQFGLPVVWGSDRNWLPIVKKWVDQPQANDFHFPDETAQIIDDMVKKYARM